MQLVQHWVSYFFGFAPIKETDFGCFFVYSDYNDLTNLNAFAKRTFPKLYWIDLSIYHINSVEN